MKLSPVLRSCKKNKQTKILLTNGFKMCLGQLGHKWPAETHPCVYCVTLRCPTDHWCLDFITVTFSYISAAFLFLYFTVGTLSLKQHPHLALMTFLPVKSLPGTHQEALPCTQQKVRGLTHHGGQCCLPLITMTQDAF